MVNNLLNITLLLFSLLLVRQAFCEDSPQQQEAERIMAALESEQPGTESLLLSALENDRDATIGIGAIQQFALKRYGLGTRECGWQAPELNIPSVHHRLEEMAFGLPSESKIGRGSAMALSFIREIPEDELRYFERMKSESDWMYQGVWLSILMTNGLCNKSIVAEVAEELTKPEPKNWAIELGKRIAKSNDDPKHLLLEPFFTLVESEEYFLDFEVLWAIAAYQPLSQDRRDKLQRWRETLNNEEMRYLVPENVEATKYALDQILEQSGSN